MWPIYCCGVKARLRYRAFESLSYAKKSMAADPFGATVENFDASD
jgi:hypothetical protein